MLLWQEGWVWIVAGVVLAALEMLIPGFVFLGFAIGAVLVGVLVWTGLLGHALPLTLLIFAAISLVSWLVLRRAMGVRRGQTKHWDHDINDN
ncbi:hypothetical protein DL1_02100 [Thioclava dalianensis]|uniref:NfeD-like C-terminal domain-containing protein n=1 Tax=Thioclava dalianensis TaxID=1185766 RepID=A0A074TDS3_9RHOB|nr:hypothetical protein [Thioclava dalianensis]KEP69839.1 hypothetical protein DL1_02100 [Thioclava dalianensis]SFM87378.1 hypothetical protein SAMN05216224_101698 [Thioclava dalianensis]